MDEQKPEPSTLEYLVRNRALHFSRRSYTYLTIKQRIIYWAVLRSMADFERCNRTTVVISELILDVKDYLTKLAVAFNKLYGTKVGKSYSKECIRQLIYLGIPLLLNIQQHHEFKVLSLTRLSKQFAEWLESTHINTETGKEEPNYFVWFSKNKINYTEPPSNS